MRVSAAGNMPLQGLVKPPAKPVVMIYGGKICNKSAAYAEARAASGRFGEKQVGLHERRFFRTNDRKKGYKSAGNICYNVSRKKNKCEEEPP